MFIFVVMFCNILSTAPLYTFWEINDRARGFVHFNIAFTLCCKHNVKHTVCKPFTSPIIFSNLKQSDASTINSQTEDNSVTCMSGFT